MEVEGLGCFRGVVRLAVDARGLCTWVPKAAFKLS